MAGSFARSASAIRSTDGREAMYVGVRCSIVTDAAVSARAGTSVTAVAPLPTTTTSGRSARCCAEEEGVVMLGC